MGQLWHLTFEAEGRRTLYESEATLRLAVRRLAEVAGARVVLFCIVDDHIHVVVRCTREEAAHLVQTINLALRSLAAVPIKRNADVKPVTSRSHLTNLVRYVVSQPPHHKLPVHPALWAGSCFPDLIGARAIGALGQPLPPLLPRVPIEHIMAFADLPPRRLAPADNARLRAAGAFRIASSALAALAVPPGATHRIRALTHARAATAQLAAAVGIPTSETASALGVSCTTVRELQAYSLEATVLSATRLRIALEDAVGEALGLRAGERSRCGRGREAAPQGEGSQPLAGEPAQCATSGRGRPSPPGKPAQYATSGRGRPSPPGKPAQYATSGRGRPSPPGKPAQYATSGRGRPSPRGLG